MASCRGIQHENQNGSNSFYTDVCVDADLHPVVRSIMLAHNQDEPKEQSNTFKSNTTSFHTHGRGKSIGEYRRARVNCEEQILPLKEESRRATVQKKDRDTKHRDTKNRDSNLEGIHDTSYRIRHHYHQEKTRCRTDSNRASFERDSRKSPPLNHNGQELQERIKFFQERIEFLTERTKPSFQSSRRRPLPIEDIEQRLNNSAKESESYRGNKESLNSANDEMFLRREHKCRSLGHEDKDGSFVETMMKYRDLLDYYEARRLQRQRQRLGIERCPLLPLNIERSSLRDQSSRDFDDHVTNDIERANCHEEVEKLCDRVRAHVSIIRHRTHSSRSLLAKRDADHCAAWKEFHERNSPGQEWAEFNSKCYDSDEEPGDLSSLARVDSGSEDTEKSSAFDPFPQAFEKPDSQSDTAWCDSNSSSETQDVVKSPELSKDECHAGDMPAGISILSEAMTSIENEQNKNGPSGTSLKSKETNRLPIMRAISEIHNALVCTNKRKKSFDEKCGQQSQGTVESSSCTSPSTDNSDDSRNRSNRVFLKAKASNKEWLRTSIEGNLSRKSEIEMQEWLNDAIIPGWDIARQDASRCGPMEMVFFDRVKLEQHKLKEQ